MKTSLPASLATAFPKRPADMHKYSAGVVTVIGGCARYPHAPVIAALGVRAGGAGLVQLAVPDASRAAAGALVPEATFAELAPGVTPPRTDVTALGMGLGDGPDSEALVAHVLSCAGRFVVDASALAVLARLRAADALPSVEGCTLVLTPHVGEAARLLDCTTDEIQSDRSSAVRRLVESYRAVVVLKGPHTLVASPDRAEVFAYLSKSRPDPDAAFLAACGAVWLHSAASDALVAADPPGDPSIVNTAHAIASLRVALEKAKENQQ